MRLLLACSTFGLALGACATDPADSPTGATGKADGAGSSIRVIQAGVFRDDLGGPTGYVPKLLHYGFVTERGPDWKDVNDVQIPYDNHTNKSVIVDIPPEHQGELLAFVLYEESSFGPTATAPWYTHWSAANAYIDLAKHGHGALATFPVVNNAGYPFSDACYQVYIDQAEYTGKVTAIDYGFTTASKADYDANNDVPWLTASDDHAAEGELAPAHQHDGDYKGEYVMIPEYVWVPDGEHLVFKLQIDKYHSDGGWYCGGTQYFDGHASTKTYFAE